MSCQDRNPLKIVLGISTEPAGPCDHAPNIVQDFTLR